MTAALFLGFLAVVTAAVLMLAGRYLPRGTAAAMRIGLPAWLLYVGLLGYLGVVRNAALPPPGVAFILVPAAVFIVLFVARSATGGRIALAVPLWVLLGLQGYRAGVELVLHQLWLDGLAPKMLTFEGANVDILIGVSAPVVAWLSTRRRPGLRLALAWNVLGLLALANVATRSALTAPGPLNLIHAEVPNLALGTFPFMFIPGFFAPLAVVLHVLAIRSLRSRLSAAELVPSPQAARGAREGAPVAPTASTG